MRLPPAATSPRWRLSKKGQQAAPVAQMQTSLGKWAARFPGCADRRPGGRSLVELLVLGQALAAELDSHSAMALSELASFVALRRGVLKGCRSPNAQPLRGLNREEKKLFDDQQMVVAARPRAAAVEFTADLPGWLWIDGRYRGVAPLRVSDLSSGRHFFTFVVPGGEASVSWREPDWPGTGQCR